MKLHSSSATMMVCFGRITSFIFLQNSSFAHVLKVYTSRNFGWIRLWENMFWHVCNGLLLVTMAWSRIKIKGQSWPTHRKGCETLSLSPFHHQLKINKQWFYHTRKFRIIILCKFLQNILFHFNHLNVLISKGRPRNNDLWNWFSLDLGVQMRWYLDWGSFRAWKTFSKILVNRTGSKNEYVS